MKKVWVTMLTAAAVLVTGCGDDKNPGTEDAGTDAIVRPDVYVGDCQDDQVPVFGGSHQTLINQLMIAPGTSGFDLNYDGHPDNLLGSLGGVANGFIDDSMEQAEIIIPLEFFGLDSATDDDCTNFTLYVGIFAPDQDDDGERTGGAVGSTDEDCNDWDAAININATEIVGDSVDNDCNGMADETFDGTDYIPSTDTADYDSDGYTLEDGDCDDRLPSDWPEAPAWWDAASINPGAPEICGDGFDNNCDGVADEGCDPLTTDDGVDETIPIDSLSLTSDLSEALIVFRSGRVEGGQLMAGPSRFSVTVEIESDRMLELNLTSAMLQADVTIDSNGLSLTNGMLGGVLSSQSLDRVPNIARDFLGGDENSTMLDVILGPAGTVLALPSVRICMPRNGGTSIQIPLIYCDGNADCGDTELYRCQSEIIVPDIDVDDDGIEIFLDLNLDGDDQISAIDTCIDGDGTMVQDTLDASGMVIEHCTEALDNAGNPRFVDGFSIALDFETTPTNLRGIFSSQ